MQLVFSWAPKLARKCESKHWLPCGADGRSAVGVRSRDYQIFWDGYIYLAMGLRPRAALRAAREAPLRLTLNFANKIEAMHEGSLANVKV